VKTTMLNMDVSRGFISCFLISNFIMICCLHLLNKTGGNKKRLHKSSCRCFKDSI